ncbi:MAG: YraN family protein [Desulfarculales bacterium]|jgi:putative endonuclease|nr:YraN family protein [Desulfarculales bacterium]
MNSFSRREAFLLGRQAENAAGLFLQEAGFKIVRRNLRLAGGELDLVAWDGPILVFVEVKAGKSRNVADSLSAIDQPKRKRLLSAAQAFLAKERINAHCRFDAVVVDMSGEKAICHLWRDAFRADE